MAPSAHFPSPTRGESTAVVRRKNRLCTSPPRLPLGLGPPRAWNGAWVQTVPLICRRTMSMSSPCCSSTWWGPDRAEPPREGAALCCLVLFFTYLLSRSFASQRGLHTLFLARFQVEGVALDLLDNVFLLYLTLEAAQRIFEGFTLLQSYFCQTDTPPNSSGWTE